ncbi:MAG: YdcF family protein [Oscillospiraceae bacterium]|nr:YdcF family protein [Oscillospiraceae bacterium]
MKIIRVTLLIAGLLLLTNLVILSFVSNRTMGFFLQGALSAAMILYAFLFNWISRISKKIHLVVGILCLIPIIFVSFLFIYGNVNNVDHGEDVVIVLGAGLRGEEVGRPLASRLDTAIVYWHKNPHAYIIVCGGLGSGAVITEAEAMARYLIARGIPTERILLEDRSTSTYENLKFAKEILNEYFPDGFRAVVVTNDFHIYRAVQIARQAGIEAGHLGAPTTWYTWPMNYLREMLAVVNQWAFLTRTQSPELLPIS